MQLLHSILMSTDEQAEANNILNRLGTTYTFEDVIKDGIKQRWGGTYGEWK